MAQRPQETYLRSKLALRSHAAGRAEGDVCTSTRNACSGSIPPDAPAQTDPASAGSEKAGSQTKVGEGPLIDHRHQRARAPLPIVISRLRFHGWTLVWCRLIVFQREQHILGLGARVRVEDVESVHWVRERVFRNNPRVVA